MDLDSLSADQKCFHEAAKNNSVAKLKEMINNLVNSKDELGKTPLQKVLFRDSSMNVTIETVAYLVKIGADLNGKYCDGMTLLSQAIHEVGAIRIVKFLIDYGANVNAKDDNDGYTPIHWAAKDGNVEIAKLLIASGAKIDVKDNDGDTPLHEAAYSVQLDIVKLLIDSGATIDIKNNKDMTPLHIAASQNEYKVVKCLVENGAQIDPKDKENRTPHFLAAKYDCCHVVNYLTKVKKRKAENEPREIFDSKDPCVLCLEPRNEFYVLLPCGAWAYFTV